jgi:hypothetical protein
MINSDFKKVTTLAEACSLNAEEMMDGYWHGLQGGTQTGSDRSRAFLHGWRNGRVDAGLAEPDAAQEKVAAEFHGMHQGARQ